MLIAYVAGAGVALSVTVITADSATTAPDVPPVRALMVKVSPASTTLSATGLRVK